MTPTFKDICKYLAAKNCYEGGMAIPSIARQAKVPQATIREWLKYFPRYRSQQIIPARIKQ